LLDPLDYRLDLGANLMGWSGKTPMQWAREVPARLLAVKRGAIEGLARDLTQTKPRGGRVPIKHGNLYRSLLMSTTGMPTIAASGTEFKSEPVFNMGEVQLGRKVWLGYQAAHAARQNYGFVGTDSLGRTYNQSGSGFLEAAIANWPAIVRAEAEYVRNKVMGSK